MYMCMVVVHDILSVLVGATIALEMWELYVRRVCILFTHNINATMNAAGPGGLWLDSESRVKRPHENVPERAFGTTFRVGGVVATRRGRGKLESLGTKGVECK